MKPRFCIHLGEESSSSHLDQYFFYDVNVEKLLVVQIPWVDTSSDVPISSLHHYHSVNTVCGLIYGGQYILDDLSLDLQPHLSLFKKGNAPCSMYDTSSAIFWSERVLSWYSMASRQPSMLCFFFSASTSALPCSVWVPWVLCLIFTWLKPRLGKSLPLCASIMIGRGVGSSWRDLRDLTAWPLKFDIE